MNNKVIMWSMLFLILLGLYILGEGIIFVEGIRVKFAAILLVSITIYYYIDRARSGEEIYLRTIPGLKALEEAVGRATEMGKSVLFVPGISDLDQVETITGLNILGHVAEILVVHPPLSPDLNGPQNRPSEVLGGPFGSLLKKDDKSTPTYSYVTSRCYSIPNCNRMQHKQ